MTDLARLVLDELRRDPAALDELRELIGDGAGPEPWVGVPKAAEHLHCNPQRIYNLVSEGRIPYRKDGSRLLFRLSELDGCLE